MFRFLSCALARLWYLHRNAHLSCISKASIGLVCKLPLRLCLPSAMGTLFIDSCREVQLATWASYSPHIPAPLADIRHTYETAQTKMKAILISFHRMFSFKVRDLKQTCSCIWKETLLLFFFFFIVFKTIGMLYINTEIW